MKCMNLIILLIFDQAVIQFQGEKSIYLTKFLPALGIHPEKIKVLILLHVIH